MKKLNVTKKHKSTLVFFIGTEAEFIKLFPVLQELEKQQKPYKIIASGQNDISKSLLFTYVKHQTIDLTLSDGPRKQTQGALMLWFFTTCISGYFTIKKYLPDNKNTVIIVHGDTISTVMGAYIGKLLGFQIVHIEAGLRSFNFRHPFPEEIDRVLTSKVVSIHFTPNKWAMKNLENISGKKINTIQNTLLDSLRIVTQKSINTELLRKVKNKKYFIFVMHRQENLMNESLVREIIEIVLHQTKNLTCVFVVHKPTKVALEKYDLFSKIEKNKNIITTNRLPYIEIMNLMKKAEFLITDGGSNQEESYYFGKPCLILREHTERIEGLDENVLLSMNNLSIIKDFFKNYKTYERKPITKSIQPSKIIVQELMNI
jgi:UDP-N-acetylglucosamine 2-epimerase (non-hydrolysing)